MSHFAVGAEGRPAEERGVVVADLAQVAELVGQRPQFPSAPRLQSKSMTTMVRPPSASGSAPLTDSQ